MRWVLPLLLLASACQRQSFDERYEETAAELNEKAERLDAQANRTTDEDARPSSAKDRR